ncbi:peptidase A2 [Paenibacillus sp. FSL H8-0548]|uniref:S1C family serine protease n=1 Tax=Paenibacillus sp. FSL H8-0548 TaxID=1920422 RepID=UPI00096C43C3|nr:trypsin-like peptidase domain-containing protein [Paenibacillus sp. FSL H8-0548]OMF32154.1 peptidase A2 [Paenibacillus sp. FSL H8-0548]
MDDQNKKNDFDDFFRKNEDAQGAADQNESGINAESEVSNETPEQAAKPSYYYSYGPFKANSQENGASSQADSEANQPKLIQDQPYGNTGGSSSSSSAFGLGQEVQKEAIAEPSNAAPRAPQQSQIRSFTPSPQSAKGPWQVREQRRSSFRAMFLSFLVGVLLVGSLMYAADMNNWFTNGNTLTTNTQSSGSGAGSTSAGTAAGSGAATVAARPDNIAQLFETASPAVVKIETYINTAKRSSSSSMLDDSFFRQFFGDNYPGTTQPEAGQGGEKDSMQQSGIGTGFFFDSTGYILTNQHVVGDSDQIKVIVQGHETPFTAELLGSSYDLDLAVLKITGDEAFPTLPLGNSDNINIGDWVVAIGNPYGFDHTVTVGVLSAKERPIDIQDTQGERNYEHLLQTDASINPGNSGGPLMNIKGEVVGINTAVSSQAQGIGFAIPTSTIQEVLESLKNDKEIPKPAAPYIGAELRDVTADIAKQLGMTTVEGSIVQNVYYNSPAYLGGLQQFDVITGIDGKKYDNTTALIEAIKAKSVGDKVQLNVLRKGTAVNVDVVIGDKNNPTQ